MSKYLKAEFLSELFRDMAEFASSDEERRVLLIAAQTVEELPGDEISDEKLISSEDDLPVENEIPDRKSETDVRGGGYSLPGKFSFSFRSSAEVSDSGFRNAEGYGDPTAYFALRNIERGRKGKKRRD